MHYYILQRVAKMDMDWNLTKLGQRFQRFQRLQKSITKKKLLWLVLPDEIFLISSR